MIFTSEIWWFLPWSQRTWSQPCFIASWKTIAIFLTAPQKIQGQWIHLLHPEGWSIIASHLGVTAAARERAHMSRIGEQGDRPSLTCKTHALPKKETVKFCLVLILWHRMCSRSILGRGELWAEPGKHKNEFSWMEVQLGEIGGRGANLSTFDKLKKREGSNCCVDISVKTWDEGPKPRVPSVPSRLGRM